MSKKWLKILFIFWQTDNLLFPSGIIALLFVPSLMNVFAGFGQKADKNRKTYKTIPICLNYFIICNPHTKTSLKYIESEQFYYFKKMATTPKKIRTLFN